MTPPQAQIYQPDHSFCIVPSLARTLGLKKEIHQSARSTPDTSPVTIFFSATALTQRDLLSTQQSQSCTEPPA